MPARFSTLGGVLAIIGLVLVVVLAVVGKLELTNAALFALAFLALLL